MNFTVEFSEKAIKDIQLFEKTGDASILRKIDKLIRELELHPRTGTGKPEFLTYKKY